MQQASTTQWPDVRSVPFKLETRHEPRRLVRVVVRPETQNVAGNLCKRGENFVIVYERDLPALQAMTATPETKHRLEMARTSFASAFAKHLKSHANEADALRTIGESVESKYYDLYDEEVPPLDEFEVYPTQLEPPDSDQLRVQKSQASNDRATQTMADVVHRLAESSERTNALLAEVLKAQAKK